MIAATSAIGVRALKAHLSEQLARVQAGATLTVTDRDRPIATLAPIQAPRDIAWVERMVSAGQAHWGGGKPIGLKPPVKSRRKGKTASQVVIEDRG